MTDAHTRLHARPARVRASSGPLGELKRQHISAPTSHISSDIFDTVILRDSSTETKRLALAARRAALRLGIDPEALIRMRWVSQQNAYRAVAMERPDGDARLLSMCAAAVGAFGLGVSAALVLRDAELEVDAEHLRPNRPLLDYLGSARALGARVIAVSDVYYSADEVVALLTAVTGRHPFHAVYTSADLQATKFGGQIFQRVAHAEQVDGSSFLHVGDNYRSDVTNAREAGWRAVHAPRGRVEEWRRVAGRIASLQLRMRRDQ